MKRGLLYIFLFIQLVTVAQKGNTFPSLNGFTLDGKPLHCPPANGKYTVLAIAFHKGAEDDLKKWLNPLYNAFIKKEKGSGNFDVAEIYDVNFVFVPLIAGFKKVAEEFKNGSDKAFWEYILDTDKTDIKAVEKELGISNTKQPYFYILDKEGKIVAIQSGSFNEGKLEQLEDAVE